MSKTQEAIEEMKARYEELELAKDSLYDALDAIQDAEQNMPRDLPFSHHAEMEIGECIEAVEKLMRMIEEKVWQ
tara:strand:- start:1966 stop:2187 length:222 start_codon:yes stop_codon:yes gene_type:complete